MSSPKKAKKISPPRSFGWMAEYADEHQLLDACRKVRDSGYTRTDAFAPFPVHGIDEALGIKPTVLPWIVLCFGLTGMSLALLMEWWMNAVSYPYIISGKPFFSLPAFIPVMFESTILFSAFSTLIGMILLNGLPRFSNPVFSNPRFDRSTDDRFFLWVDSRDRYFNSDKVKALLESTGPLSLDAVKEDDSSDHIPPVIWRTIAALILLTLIPGSIILRMRASTSELPRWQVFFDMDFQPKKKAQQTTTLFADGRASRLPVAGTIARGDLTESDPYYLGYTPADLALNAGPTATRMVMLQSSDAQTAAQPDQGQPPAPAKSPAAKADAKQADKPQADKAKTDKSDTKAADQSSDKAADKADDKSQAANANKANKTAKPNGEAKDAKQSSEQDKAADKEKAVEAAKQQAAQVGSSTKPTTPGSVPPAAAADATAAAPSSAQPELPWVETLPFDGADEKMMALGQLKFETNCAVCHGYAGNGDGLVSQRALQLAQGYWVQPTSLHDPAVRQQPVGKIFHTITNGRGKMGAYGPVLTAKERWAIVLYVKALQRSQDAKLEDVPPAQREKLTAAPAK